MHVAEKLEDYLRRTGQTGAEFAGIVQVAPNTVYRWLRGKTFPQRGIMPRVIAATGGAVTADSFYQPLVTRAAS